MSTHTTNGGAKFTEEWLWSGPTTSPLPYRVDTTRNAGQGLPCLICETADRDVAKLIASLPSAKLQPNQKAKE